MSFALPPHTTFPLTSHSMGRREKSKGAGKGAGGVDAESEALRQDTLAELRALGLGLEEPSPVAPVESGAKKAGKAKLKGKEEPGKKVEVKNFSSSLKLPKKGKLKRQPKPHKHPADEEKAAVATDSNDQTQERADSNQPDSLKTKNEKKGKKKAADTLRPVHRQASAAMLDSPIALERGTLHSMRQTRQRDSIKTDIGGGNAPVNRKGGEGGLELSAALQEQLERLKHPLCEMKESQTYWFQEAETKLPNKGKKGKGSEEALLGAAASWFTLAKELFEKEVLAWEARRARSATGDDKYLAQVLRTGTLSDRVAALTLRCQESPVHRLSALQSLLEMCAKKERRVAQTSIEAVKDLCMNNLLPDNRRLVPFSARSGARISSSSPSDIARALVVWYYEDQLKGAVDALLGALERAARDTVSSFKRFSMGAAEQLIESKPEGEVRLLTLLVNKLGDPDRNTSSLAVRLLQTLLKKHPRMKPVVIREVQQYLHRPGLAAKGVYVAVVLLCDVQLTAGEDQEVAAALVKTYFQLFERAVAAEDLRSRLLSVLLTGVKRAVPYLSHGTSSTPLHEHIDQLFRLCHVGTFATATQALSLLWQMSNTPRKGKGGGASTLVDSSTKSRFYAALYAKLQSEDLQCARQPSLFLNLVFKALQADSHRGRITALCKRLLQTALVGPPNLAAASLMVVSEALKKHQFLRQPLLSGRGAAGEGKFDPSKRDPCYACTSGANDKMKNDGRAGEDGAALPSLWEVSLLRAHYHPSVSSFADSLLTPPGYGIRYKGDPLADFTLGPFLDKMAYKHPKQGAVKSGGAKRSVGGVDSFVGSKGFASMPNDLVGANEAFFHKYFKDRSHREASGEAAKRKAKKSAKEHASDVDSGAEEDKFADKIAEEFMRSAGGGMGPSDDEDPNMKGWSGSDFAEDSDDDDEAERHIGDMEGGEPGDGEDFMDQFQGESSDDDNHMEDIDDDNEVGTQSEPEDSDTGEAVVKARHTPKQEVPVSGKKRRSKKTDIAFASADDYADILDKFDPEAPWLNGGGPAPVGKRRGAGAKRGNKKPRLHGR
jgi:ribosome biogenesis protein MAK21